MTQIGNRDMNAIDHPAGPIHYNFGGARMESANIPIACKLSAAELRLREATLIAEFKSGVTGVEELGDGYRFALPGEAKWLEVIAALMAAERECCPFLEFHLHAAGNRGGFALAITGPGGSKDFLRALFL